MNELIKMLIELSSECYLTTEEQLFVAKVIQNYLKDFETAKQETYNPHTDEPTKRDLT